MPCVAPTTASFVEAGARGLWSAANWTFRRAVRVHRSPPNPFDRQAMPPATLEVWQEVVDLVVAVLSVPAALVHRVDGSDVEVFVASRSPGNPYRVGHRLRWAGSGLYVESVVREDASFALVDARLAPGFTESPDFALGMVSYLGVPIHRPGGSVFGALGALDRGGRQHPKLAQAELGMFARLLESSLSVVSLARELEEKRKDIGLLGDLLPLCSYCRSIRDEKGTWKSVEQYARDREGSSPSHGICPECLHKHFPDQDVADWGAGEEDETVRCEHLAVVDDARKSRRNVAGRK